MRIVNRTRGVPLAERAVLAARWTDRLRGLIGRPPLAPGEGLVIRPCAGVHTCFMRGPIDVALIAAEGTVLRVYERLLPWRATAIVAGAAAAVELPAGALGATRVGDRLDLEE